MRVALFLASLPVFAGVASAGGSYERVPVGTALQFTYARYDSNPVNGDTTVLLGEYETPNRQVFQIFRGILGAQDCANENVAVTGNFSCGVFDGGFVLTWRANSTLQIAGKKYLLEVITSEALVAANSMAWVVAFDNITRCEASCLDGIARDISETAAPNLTRANLTTGRHLQNQTVRYSQNQSAATGAVSTRFDENVTAFKGSVSSAENGITKMNNLSLTANEYVFSEFVRVIPVKIAAAFAPDVQEQRMPFELLLAAGFVLVAENKGGKKK